MLISGDFLIMKKYILEKWPIIRGFFEKYGQGMMLWVGMLSVGAIGFEAGMIQGRMEQAQPLVIEKPAASGLSQVAGESTEALPGNISKTIAKKEGEIAPTDGGAVQKTGVTCRFVGSKNSDKYHLSSCAVVKRIKPENRVCFSSEEDAKSKGYQAGCIK